MSMQKLSTQMGISFPKAYALLKESDFLFIRIGTRRLISTDWFKESARMCDQNVQDQF